MAQQTKPLILVVDDNDDYRETLTVLLLREGYDVECAENGREALDCLNNAKPALIILDLLMPIMGGLEFLRQLRAACCGLRQVPVIVTTGICATDEPIDATAVLQKPFAFGTLQALVRENASPQL